MGFRFCFTNVDGKANVFGGQQEDGLKPVTEFDGVRLPLGTLINTFSISQFCTIVGWVFPRIRGCLEGQVFANVDKIWTMYDLRDRT